MQAGPWTAAFSHRPTVGIRRTMAACEMRTELNMIRAI